MRQRNSRNQEARTRLLIVLSDGRPYDHDYGDARYAREDTREALKQAKIQGITPFCITIDRESEVRVARPLRRDWLHDYRRRAFVAGTITGYLQTTHYLTGNLINERTLHEPRKRFTRNCQWTTRSL